MNLNLVDVEQNEQNYKSKTDFRSEKELLQQHEFSPEYEVTNFQNLFPLKEGGPHFKFE